MASKSKSDQRTRRVPGQVMFRLPEGWAYHPTMSNYITPTLGMHAGAPFAKDSTIAKLLGWPGPCLTGHVNVTIQYSDGTSLNLHEKVLKEMQEKNGDKKKGSKLLRQSEPGRADIRAARSGRSSPRRSKDLGGNGTNVRRVSSKNR